MKRHVSIARRALAIGLSLAMVSSLMPQQAVSEAAREMGVGPVVVDELAVQDQSTSTQGEGQATPDGQENAGDQPAPEASSPEPSAAEPPAQEASQHSDAPAESAVPEGDAANVEGATSATDEQDAADPNAQPAAEAQATDGVAGAGDADLADKAVAAGESADAGQADEAKGADDETTKAAAKEAEEAKKVEEQKKAEEAKRAEEEAKKAEEQKKAEEEAKRSAAFSKTAEVDGVVVRVEAEAGAFPADATLSVTRAPEAQRRAVDDAVAKERDDSKKVAVSYTFDVKVLDEKGTELQPAGGKKVKVSFESREVANGNLETDVYHVSGGHAGEALVAEKLNVEEQGAEVKAQTDGFSYYTVEFTYGNLQYVMIGNATVPLSTVLETVGLTGEPTEVEVSNSELFTVFRDDGGTWQVAALQAFSTTEWMRLIIDGVAYEIVVTDASFNFSAKITGTYPSGCLKSMTVTISPIGSYGAAYGKVAVHSKHTKYNWDNRYLSSGQSNWNSVDVNYLKQNDGLLVFSNSEFKWTDWSSSSPGTVPLSFDDGVINLKGTATYYVELWTRSSQYGIYGDGLITTLQADGSGGMTDGNGQQVEVAHTHSWSVTASGATAKVKCTAANCSTYTTNKEYSATISASNATYDGNSHGATVTKASGFPSEATVSTTYTGTTKAGSSYNSTTAPKAAGSYTATATVKAGSSSKTISVNYTIAQKEIGVSWSGTSLTYNGKEQGPTATATGLVLGTSCSVTVTGKKKDVGTYTATADSLGNANYKLPATKPTQQYTINKADLTVTAKNKTITYGDAPANDGVTYKGLVNGEKESVLGGTLDYAYTYEQYGDAGTYENAIIPWGLTSSNYNITFAKGTLTVAPAALTVAAKPKTITYGDEPANDGVTYTGFVNGEKESVLGGTLAYDYGYAQYQNVGTYENAIKPKGLSSNNYAITFVPATLTVNKATLYAKANNNEITYGEAPANAGVSYYDGFKGNDTKSVVNETNLKYTYSYQQYGDTGEYTITPSGLSATNYDFDYRDGKLTVVPAKLTVTANPKTITYGEAPANDGVTFSGFQSSDTHESLKGMLDYDYTYRQYDDVGIYEIMPKGLSSKNYDITFAKGELTVAKRPITVTADDKSSIYLEALAPFSYRVTQGSVVNNNQLDVTYTCNDSADTPLKPSSHVGTYAIVPKVTNPSANKNYQITYANGTYTLNKQNIAGAEWHEYKGTYDAKPHSIEMTLKQWSDTGAEQAQVFYSLQDFATMDGVDLIDVEEDLTGAKAEELRQRFATGDLKDVVSTEKPTATNVDETPLDVYFLVLSDNYHVLPGISSVTITKAKLTVTAKDWEITYGDAPANNGVTYDGFVNDADRTSLSGSLAYAYDYRRYQDVGEYTITPKGLSTRNYDIAYVSGKLTVRQRLAMLSWAPGPFVYDGAQQGPQATVQTVNGDDVHPDQLAEGTTALATEVGNYTATYGGLAGSKAHNYTLDTDTASHKWSIVRVKNNITSVSMDGWVYGMQPYTPSCTATWGADTAHYVYSARPDGGFVEYDPAQEGKYPTQAGTYYLRAIIDQGANYERAESDLVPFTIEKAKIGICAIDATHKFDETLTSQQLYEWANLGSPDAHYCLGGYVEGDDLGVTLSVPTPESGIFSVGTHPIKVSWNNNPNYDATLVDGDYYITATDMGAVADDYDGVYDGKPHGITVTVTPESTEATVYYATEPIDKDNYDTVGSTEPVTRTDEGLTDVYWYAAPKSDPKAGVGGRKGVYIQTKPLTIMAKDKTITYGDEGASDGLTYDGFVEGEDENTAGIVDASGLSFSYGEYHAGMRVGTYPIVPAGVKARNYEVRFVNGTLTVDPRVAELDWGKPVYDYNGRNQGPTPRITNMREGDDVELNLEDALKVGVGDYRAKAVGLGGSSAKNYALPDDASKTEFDWHIVKKTNVVSASIAGWTYGSRDESANAPKATATFGAETATFSYATSPNGPFSTDVPTAAGTYYLKATVPGGEGYDEASDVCEFAIKRAPLSIESPELACPYVEGITQDALRGALPEATVTGLVEGDDASALGVVQDVVAGPYEAGRSYAVTPSYDRNALIAANYDVRLVSGKVTLSSAGVSFSAKGYAGAYDGRPHGIQVGLFDGSALAEVWYSTTELTADNYNDAGVATRNARDPRVTRTDSGKTTVYYYVVPRGADPKAEPGKCAAGSRDVDITKASLVVAARDQAVTYGEAPDAHAERDGEGKLSKAGLSYDVPSGMTDDLDVSGLAYDYGYAQYGPVGDGAFPVTPKGVTSGNYELTFVQGTLTVARKTLSVSWPDDRWWIPYEGEAVTMLPKSLDGIENGDDVSIDRITGNRATEIGEYTAHALTIRGEDAANYVLEPSSFDWKVVKQDSNEWVRKPEVGQVLNPEAVEAGEAAVRGWVYGHAPEKPASEPRYGKDTVVYYYRPAESTDDADWTTAVPTQAGDYVMRAVTPETESYTGLDAQDADPKTGANLLVPFTIERAKVAIVPDDKTSGYGEDIAALTYAVTGDLAAGDVIQATLAAVRVVAPATESEPEQVVPVDNRTPVGEYEVRVASVADNPNYVVDPSAIGRYTITRTALEVEASGWEGTYDDQRHGITVTYPSTHPVTGADVEATTYYSNKEIDLETFAKLKTEGRLAEELATDPLDERVSLHDVGEIEVWYYVDTANYQAVPVYGHKVVTVTKAPLTVTANDSAITFGDAPVAAGVRFDGLVGDDVAHAEGSGEGQVTGTEAFSFAYERFGDVGTYAITPSGLDSHNYEITYADGTLTVGRRAIARDMLSLEPDQFTWDGTAKSPKVALTFKHEDGATFELAPGRDFEVSGATSAAAVDTYRLLATGRGNFEGEVDQTWRIDGGDDETVIEQKRGDGKLKVTVDVWGEGLSLASDPEGLTADLAWSLLDEGERVRVQAGEEAHVYLVMRRQDTPAAADAAPLASVVSGLGAKAGMYFDVTLWKRVGDTPATSITQTGSDIGIKVDVPEELKNKSADAERSFGVGRAHEGVGEVVSTPALSTSDPVPFSTAKFSGYVLAYRDVDVPKPETGQRTGAIPNGLSFMLPTVTRPATRTTPTRLAKTGDESAPAQALLGLTVAAMLALVAGLVVRRRRKE